MRRLVLITLATLVALPAGAAAKGEPLFVPQLLSLLPNVPTREELYMFPYANRREVVPAPPAGAVPVVVLRSGALTRRFAGTPLDGLDRSVVWIEVPQAPSDRKWVASVEVAGRTYPEIDETTIPGSAWFVPAAPTRARAAASAAPWPWMWILAAGGVLVLAGLTAAGRRLHFR